MRERLGSMVIGMSKAGVPVTTDDLGMMIMFIIIMSVCHFMYYVVMRDRCGWCIMCVDEGRHHTHNDADSGADACDGARRTLR